MLIDDSEISLEIMHLGVRLNPADCCVGIGMAEVRAPPQW